MEAGKIALFVIIATYIGFTGFLFQHNLPLWCATPNVGHNYVVQPFCK